MLVVLTALMVIEYFQITRKPDFTPEMRWNSNDLSQRSIGSVGFDLVFLLRRILFVCILIFLHHDIGLQLICHLQLTLLYVIYIGYNMPYKKYWSNIMAIINESVVILSTYVLIILCNDQINSD